MRPGNETGTLVGEVPIREALRSHLQGVWGECPETVVIEELGLCQGRVRVDVAAVNGTLHAFEIKSDRDRLDRLPTQVEVYSKVVDRATIVVGARHIDSALEIVPAWWGVLLVGVESDGVRLEPVRGGSSNPARDPRALVELLWREEALSLLEARDSARGVKSKPRAEIWDRVCECCEVDEIAAVVRDRLRSRAGTASPARSG